MINDTFGGDFEILPGYACFYAGGESRDSKAVTEELLREAERLGRGEIDDAFYNRIRRAAYGSWIRGLNSFENIAVSLTEGYFHGCDPFRFPQVFETVTKEDIAAFLRENVTESRCAVSEVFPRESGAE